ncbi:MAG: hypothetical protein K8F30_06120 [Taibaiella sp.]|nr:hypothetical protein [Taibaiella sp.]
MAESNPIFYFKVTYQVTRDGQHKSFVKRYNKSADPLNDGLPALQEKILGELKQVYPDAEFEFALTENKRIEEDEFKTFEGEK